FRAVPDVDELLLKLQDIWLGNYKLRVNISKFRRNDPKPLPTCPSPGQLAFQENITPCDGRSFAEILTNNNRKLQGVVLTSELPPPPALRSVAVSVCSERLNSLAKSLVGYLKTEVDLLTFMDSLVLHGLSDITVCPMGGGLVLFSSKVEGLLLSLFDPAQDWWG
ncbi:hypothetical protein A2U01_0040460, partial [Trifolium medium]|nr:hypothetical protein [Trifolium medium]